MTDYAALAARYGGQPVTDQSQDYSTLAAKFGAVQEKQDPKIGQPEELSFAEKYIAPVLDKLGTAIQSDPGAIGSVSRAITNDGNMRGGVVGRTMQGLADPGVAIVQAGANAISPLVSSPSLSSLVTGQDDSLAGRVNRGIADEEKKYQAARKSSGSEGFDPARLAGNIGMSAFTAAALPGLPAGTPALAKAALTGAGYSALTPVTDGGDHYWAEKGKEAAIGAIAGPLTAKVGGLLARIVSPNASVNPNIKLLRDENVDPSIGQSLGGWANALEEKAQSLPIIGPAIQRARQRGGEQLEDAAFRRAADPIGATIGGRGNEGIAELSKKLGAAYDKVIPNMAVDVLDPTFVGKMSSLRGLVQNLPKQEADQFDNVIAREIDARLSPNGTLSGQALKDAWNALRDKAQTFSKSSDAYQVDLGRAFKQAFQELKDHVSTSNSVSDVLALKNADFGYANFKRLQRAASSVAAENGRPTPAMLHNAVKAMDSSKDKARFSEGDALMQDLSAAGKTVLSNKVPDSGTPARVMLAAMTGGAAFAPVTALAAAGGLGAGAAAYTAPVQNALRKLLLNRPGSAPQVANELRRIMQAGSVVTVPMIEQMAR